MSLDVYLKMDGAATLGTGIYVRMGGETKEISRAEWDEKFPGREPVVAEVFCDNEAYSRNITHNLCDMAREAGVYECLWEPEEIGVTKAVQLIEPLRVGLALLKSDPPRFEKFNPENGWGSYAGLVDFVGDYLNACMKYPSATVEVSR